LQQVAALQNTLASIYDLTDPISWDPFSRAKRLSQIFSVVADPETSDVEIRHFLEALETKRSLTSGNDIQETAELNNYEKKRTLFNYSSLPPFRASAESQGAKRPKYSHVSEYLLAAILVATVSYLGRLPKSSGRFLHYDRELRTKGAWLERTFLNSTSRAQNTFLLNYIIEKKLFSERNSRDANGEVLLPLNLSNEVLQEILEQLGKSDLFRFADLVPRKATTNQQEMDLRRKDFAALLHVHHEVSENAMAHGINSHLNPNAANFDYNKMGVMFFVEMAELVLSRSNVSGSTQSTPLGFEEYHSSASKRDLVTYSVYSYYDNGIGIQNHLKENRKTESEKIGISEIMGRKLSTRQITGSGAGLSKVRAFSESLGAFLTIDTPVSSYSFNGIAKKTVETMAARITRGTLISVYLPKAK
jgi:hypothetical protein